MMTRKQLLTIILAAVFFTGNDVLMGYLSDTPSAETGKSGSKIASFQKAGSGSVLADTEWGNKIILPPKPEDAPKPNFTIYESKILNRDLFNQSTSTNER